MAEEAGPVKKRSYLENAALLTLTGLALRAAGMFLRVYIAGNMGSAGVGLYQLIFTAYGVFIALANSGVSVAATRLTAEELGRNSPAGMLGAMRRMLAVSLGMGLLAGAAQGAAADWMARYWLGDVRAALPLKILAPSLPFMAIGAAIRGCFLALRRVGPNIWAQLLEQTVRIGLVVWLLPGAMAISLRFACAAVALGSLCSEGISCLCMGFSWARQRREWKGIRPAPPPRLNRRIGAILLPIGGSRFAESLLKAAENALVPACLLGLLGREGAMASYGALKGMALPLLLFPFSFLGALATLLMPEITEAHVRGDTRQLQGLIDRMMLLTGSISVFTGGMFFLFGPALAQLLYQDAEAGLYIRVLGPVMPFMYLESMVDGVLKGLGEQMAGFRYSLWDSTLRIGAILLILPRWGMPGLLGIMIFSNIFLCALTTRRMLQVSGMRARWGHWFAVPVLLFLPAGLAGVAAANTCGQDAVRLLAGAGAAGLAYLLVWSLSEPGRVFWQMLRQRKR